MKRIIILITIIIFLLVGFGFAQDCQKCPSKSKCGKAELTQKKAELKVYISKTKKAEKLYHKKDAPPVKE